MAQAPPFAAASAKYDTLWSQLVVRPEKIAEIGVAVTTILANKARYQAVAATAVVPWFVIAAIHNMEASLNFNCHLHNGDPLTARTVHVPSGRPASGNPPFTWEASAADALNYEKMTGHTDWSRDRIAYRLEGYNGWGYWDYHPTVNTPYLWSFSNLYTAGKYGSDGKWSDTLESKQCGAMVLLKQLAAQDSEVKAAFG